MSADARRQLDQAVQRRVEQRQRQAAANWEHAVQVGRSLGLGEPLGIYHTEVIPPLGARRVLRLLSPVAVLALGATLLVLRAPAAAPPVIGVSLLLAVAYAFLVLAVTWRLGRFTRWLYGYTGGLAELDADGQPRPIRWADVADVVDAWSSAGLESPSYEGFRLTTAAGRTVLVTARYSNALDPYAPGGGLIAALMPAEVGAAFPRFPSIADLITGQAVARVVAHQAESVRGGAVVVRGGMRVTRDGIAGPKDATVTPWAAIDRIELRPGHVKVRPIGGRARTYAGSRDASGNAVLCRLLLALGANASYDATG